MPDAGSLHEGHSRSARAAAIADWALQATTPYDWSRERQLVVPVDRAVARYTLECLRQITTPAHPQAHADAIVHLERLL